MSRRFTNRLVAGLFGATLALPLLAAATGLQAGATRTERSEARPHGMFAWLDYFDSHFPLRAALIHAHALVDLHLHASPSPTVLRGTDGWLYYADDSALDDYISASPLSPDDLKAWRDGLVRTRDALRAMHVAYVFAVAPDKHVIYPEHLPRSVHRLGSEYRLEQLTEYLRATTDLTIVNLRDALLDAKRSEQVYYQTDSHWNEAGAHAGYVALLNAARPFAPDLVAAPRRAFHDAPETIAGRDLAEMLGIEQDVTERTVRLVPDAPRRARVLEPATMAEGFEVGRVVTEIADARLPRAVIFRDSFGSGLIPYLSEHFSRAVYLWQNEVDLDVVRSEQPALVIQEIVGRRLQTYVP